jgi:GNAT superfamily N-acetyltransferase
MSYLTVPLDSSYNKKDFFCGKSLLDNYLKKQASQDIKRKLCVVFILPAPDFNIKGYYSLSSGSISRNFVPQDIMKKMPESYSDLPVTLLGRLAVDKRYMKQGIGELLLLDALKRSYDISVSSIGSIAVIIDPLDKEAESFYAKYGFILLPNSGRMFLSMKTISQLFS